MLNVKSCAGSMEPSLRRAEQVPGPLYGRTEDLA